MPVVWGQRLASAAEAVAALKALPAARPQSITCVRAEKRGGQLLSPIAQTVLRADGDGDGDESKVAQRPTRPAPLPRRRQSIAELAHQTNIVKRRTLRDLKLFVLDNSMRESTVGQTRGHTLADKSEIKKWTTKCKFEARGAGTQPT